MRYCPKCKLRAPENGTTCAKCGGSLRGIGGEPAAGGGPTATAGSGGEAELVLRLQGLQHQVAQSRRSVTLLAASAGCLALLLIGVLTWLYLHGVFQYARLDGLRFEPQATAGAVEIIYTTTTGGKVEFVRKTATRTETLIDHAPPASDEQAAERRFVWAGSPAGNDTITVSYRSGLRVTSERWTGTAAD